MESIIEKNGTKYIIRIGKLPGLLGLGGAVLTVISAVILWFNSINAFQGESAKDRSKLWQKDSSQDSLLILQSKMLIEVNWNVKEILRQKHPESKYDWKSYDEIKQILLLLN